MVLDKAPEREVSLKTHSPAYAVVSVFTGRGGTLTACYYSDSRSGLDLIRCKHTLSGREEQQQ